MRVRLRQRAQAVDPARRRAPRSPATARRRSTPPTRSAGAALTIETVEDFLGNGLEINHVIEVDFEDFPEFIDALGGIAVNNKRKICAPEFDNFYRGFNLTQGRAASSTAARRSASRACARTPAPRARTTSTARSASRRCSTASAASCSPLGTFVRLPLVGWKAPKALSTDLHGPGPAGARRSTWPPAARARPRARAVMPGLRAGEQPDRVDAEKAAAVDRLLGKD